MTEQKIRDLHPEEMTAKQLQGILDREMMSEDTDPEFLLKVSCLLAERRGNAEEPVDVDAAWDSFCTDYAPFQSDPSPLTDLDGECEEEQQEPARGVPRRGKILRWISLAAAAAAVAVVIGLSRLTAGFPLPDGADPMQQMGQIASRCIGQIEAAHSASEADSAKDSSKKDSKKKHSNKDTTEEDADAAADASGTADLGGSDNSYYGGSSSDDWSGSRRDTRRRAEDKEDDSGSEDDIRTADDSEEDGGDTEEDTGTDTEEDTENGGAGTESNAEASGQSVVSPETN